MLAQVHRQHPVHQRGNAFHVVVHQQHGTCLPRGSWQSGRRRRPPHPPSARRTARRPARPWGPARSPWPVPAGGGRRRAALRAGGRTPAPKADALGDGTGRASTAGSANSFSSASGSKGELDVLAYCLAVQRAGVLEHQPHSLPRDPVGRPAGHVRDPVDADLPGVGPLDPHDQLHHGGLAGSVGADQAEYLPRLDRETHVLDGDQAAEALRQPRHFEHAPVPTIAGGANWTFMHHPFGAAACQGNPPARTGSQPAQRPTRRNVLSWPSGRSTSPAPTRNTAPSTAPRMVRRPPSTAAMITCTPTAMSITVPGDAVLVVEHQHAPPPGR